MDERNQRESIEYERWVLIGPKYTTYDYNDELWDLIWTILIHSYVILMYLIVTFIFFELPAPQQNAVVGVFKERKYFSYI